MRHTLKETASGLRRNASMNVAILVTMWVSLTLFGLGTLVAQQVDLIKGRWYDKIELTAYLCTADTTGGTCTPGQATTDAERHAIEAELASNPLVAATYYQSQDEVFEEFKVTYADSPILSTLKATDMQDLYRIKLKNPEEYQEVTATLAAMPGVQSVQDLRAFLEPLFEWLNWGRWMAVGASALLLLAAALQIVVALGGAALACVTLAAIEQFAVIEKAKPALQGFAWVGWNHVAIAMLGVVVVAVLLSMIPTLVAIRRFLKV